MDDNDHHVSLNCVDAGLLTLGEIGECPRFHWVLTAAGDVDRALLGRALLAALSRHPHLTARVHGRFTRPYREVDERSGMNILSSLDLLRNSGECNWTTGDIDAACDRAIGRWINRPFDQTRDIPVRVLLIRKGDARSVLIFSIDHSALDGVRSFRLVQDVVKAYNGVRLPEGRPIAHLRRGRGDEVIARARSRRVSVASFYRTILRDLFHRLFVAPFRPPGRIFRPGAGTSKEISFCLAAISREEFTRMLKSASAAGVKVNDLLLAAGFTALERWNRTHGKETGRMSFLVPVDVGTAALEDVISNQISFISVAASARDRANPKTLLGKVRADTASALGNGSAFSIVYLLHYASHLPRPLMRAIVRLILLTRTHVDTTMLTNVGVIWPQAQDEAKLGGSRIVDVDLIMPMSSAMGLTIGAHTFNDSLHINVTYRTAMFSREDGRTILGLLLEELRAWAALAQQTGPVVLTAPRSPGSPEPDTGRQPVASRR